LVIIADISFIQIRKLEKKKRLVYPQMIQAIKEKIVADSSILVFSPTKLAGLMNYT
jgi:hypothetical protein